MNQHSILSPCTKFELNWLRNKKLQRNLIFDGMSGKIREPMQETTSYLDNSYNVTNCFGCFEKFLAYTYSFQVSLLSDTKWQSYPGGRLFCPPSNIGVSQTLSKIGLKLLFLQNDFYVYNIFRPSTCHLLKLHQDIKKFYSFRIVSSFQNFDLNFHISSHESST